MSRFDFSPFKRMVLAMDGFKLVAQKGSFWTIERDGEFLVTTRGYPGGSPLPSGQNAESYPTREAAIKQMNWFATEYR